MLTVVINALVQQEEMVIVITCFYYVFELTEFPRTGTCTTENSSTNQGLRVRTLIHIMHIRHIMSSILITGRNTQGEMRASRCPLYAAWQRTVQNKERANQFFHSLKTMNCPAIVSTKLTGHKVPRVVSQTSLSNGGKLQCYDHYSNLPRPRAVDGSYPEFPIDTDTPA